MNNVCFPYITIIKKKEGEGTDPEHNSLLAIADYSICNNQMDS